MITVFKYSMAGDSNEYGELRIPLPAEAEVIHVNLQHNQRTLWALVNTDHEPTVRKFYIAGTGKPMPTGVKFKHLGTFSEGPFVWHVFEEVE